MFGVFSSQLSFCLHFSTSLFMTISSTSLPETSLCVWYRRIHRYSRNVRQRTPWRNWIWANIPSNYAELLKGTKAEKWESCENKTQITIIYSAVFVQLQWCTTLHCRENRDSHGTIELMIQEHQMNVPHQHKSNHTFWAGTPLPPSPPTGKGGKKWEIKKIKTKPKTENRRAGGVTCAGFRLQS